jgi:hypothetical protein
MFRSGARSSRRWPAAAGILAGVLVILAVALIAWSTTWFDEDFETTGGGWSVGLDSTGSGNWRVSNGYYEVFMLRRHSVSRSLAPSGAAIAAPFRLETTVRVMPGNIGEAGLVYACTMDEGEEGCRTFGVFPDGSYRLGRMLRGRLEDLPVATSPLALRSLTPNTLRIEVDGDTIRFYGNDRLLATITEEGLEASGEVGVFARSETEPFFVARFDSVVLSVPSQE